MAIQMNTISHVALSATKANKAQKNNAQVAFGSNDNKKLTPTQKITYPLLAAIMMGTVASGIPAKSEAGMFDKIATFVTREDKSPEANLAKVEAAKNDLDKAIAKRKEECSKPTTYHSSTECNKAFSDQYDARDKYEAIKQKYHPLYQEPKEPINVEDAKKTLDEYTEKSEEICSKPTPYYPSYDCKQALFDQDQAAYLYREALEQAQ